MILITGASGKTGGEVARQLGEHGLSFRALVRNPAKAPLLATQGGEVVVGDIDDDAVLGRALGGIKRALLVMPNGEDQLRLEKRFTNYAKLLGVRHLIKLSSLESVPESENPIPRMHVASEQHIRESGLQWTMIRPTFFTQAFLTSAKAMRDEGVLRMPAGKGTIAPTDLRDVGAVIYKVLTESGHENKSYDLTGPELLTFDDIAGQFSAELGRPVRYVDQPIDEFRARLVAAKLAPWRIDAVCRELEAIAAGVIDHTTNTVEQLLGRPATSLRAFIRDHREAFA